MWVWCVCVCVCVCVYVVALCVKGYVGLSVFLCVFVSVSPCIRFKNSRKCPLEVWGSENFMVSLTVWFKITNHPKLVPPNFLTLQMKKLYLEMISDLPKAQSSWAQSQDSVQAMWFQSSGILLTIVCGLLARRTGSDELDQRAGCPKGVDSGNQAVSTRY